MSNPKISFPESNIPEKKKDKEWYKKTIQAIVCGTLTPANDLSRSLMSDCYRFFNGTQGGDEFNFMQTAEDGDSLPAIWINYNKIRIKVEVLMGELASKGYDFSVESVNKDAVSRKMTMRNKLFVAMRMQELHQELEELYQLPIMQGDFIPKDEDELKEYMNGNYKENSEIVMKFCIKFLLKKFDWAYTRIALFRDILIAGRCFCKTELKNGWVTYKRLDPRNVVFDINASDDFLTDSTYKGYYDYMPLADAAEQFGLTKDEIEDLKRCKGFSDSPTSFSVGDLFQGDGAAKDMISQMGNRFFDGDKNSLRVMVFYAEWHDTRIEARKYSDDQYGNQHTKTAKDTDKGEDIEKKRIKTIRKAYLIGGKIVKEEGILKNEIRSCDDPSDTQMSIESLVPNYLDYTGVSKVMQLTGLQKLKDIIMYKIQLDVANAGMKGFVYDTSQLPEDWDVSEALKYLKKTGIAFINSKQNGVASSYNQFSPLDLSLSGSVSNYIEISRMIDFEMDAVSGINDARQGVVRNASLAVGVAQSALNQSNLATELLFTLFENMSQRVFNKLAALVKISWPDYKERYAPIIGDVGINFLEMDLEMDLDDYGVFVEALPPILEDKQLLVQTAQQALASGQISFKDFLTLVEERDIKVGIRKFKKAIEVAEQKAAEQAQAQQESEQQAQMEAQEMQTQRDDMKSQRTMDTKSFIEGLKGKNKNEAIEKQAVMKNLLENNG